MKKLLLSNRLKFYSTLFFYNISALFLVLTIFIVAIEMISEGFDRLGAALLGLFFLIITIITIIITGIIFSTKYELRHKENKKYLYIPFLYFFLILVIPILIFAIPYKLNEIDYKKAQEANIKNDERIKNNEAELINSIKENGIDGCIALLSTKEHRDNIDDICTLEYSKYKLDYNSCFDIKIDYYKTKCFGYIAQESKDISICEYIGKPKSDSSAMQYCIIDIIREKNISNDNIFDTSQCYNIKDNYIKEECIMSFTADFNECYNLDGYNNYNEISFKDRCINRVSGRKVNELNISLSEQKSDFYHCENIKKTGVVMDNCFLNLATNKEQCDSITDVYTKEKCYISIAKKNNDPSICLFTDGNDTFHCFSPLINEIKQCEEMNNNFKNQAQKDRCLLVVAQKTLDASLCNIIITKDVQESCNNAIKKYYKNTSKSSGFWDWR